jgi:hypothetical protein
MVTKDDMPGIPEPKTTVEVTASQLETLAQELTLLAASLQLAAKTAHAQPGKSLACYNWASVPTGLRMLRSFVAKADESRSAAELGHPLKPGQLKPRSTAKKAAKGEESRLDKLEASNEKHQAKQEEKRGRKGK